MTLQRLRLSSQRLWARNKAVCAGPQYGATGFPSPPRALRDTAPWLCLRLRRRQAADARRSSRARFRRARIARPPWLDGAGRLRASPVAARLPRTTRLGASRLPWLAAGVFRLQCAPALSMARRDFPVPLAPFGTRRNGCAFASGCGTPRPPGGRAAHASGARETLAHHGLTARWAGGRARQPAPTADYSPRRFAPSVARSEGWDAWCEFQPGRARYTRLSVDRCPRRTRYLPRPAHGPFNRGLAEAFRRLARFSVRTAHATVTTRPIRRVAVAVRHAARGVVVGMARYVRPSRRR